MEPSRRVRVGLALHAISGELLFARDEAALAALALVVALGTACIAAKGLQRITAMVAGLLTAALMLTVSYRTFSDFSHVLLLLALAVPACIDAGGTSFREGRTRWLWLRALLLALALVIGLGMWPAPHPAKLLPVLLVSHVLLRLGTPPLAGAPLSLRALVAMMLGTLAFFGIAELTDIRSVASTLPRWPYPSIALVVAFVAASMRIAPRAGVDGALAAVAALALALALDVNTRTSMNGGVVLAVVACFVAATTASRHIALRVFAGATVIGALWVSDQRPANEIAGIVIVAIVFVGVGALVTARGTLPRAPPADPTYARLGAVLHMAGLALTVFVPTASLVALVPAVVFATKPLTRFGTLALVTLSWATAPMLAAQLHFNGGKANALQAWAPWIMLALLEAARSRGHPMLVARLAVTVAALFFAIAAIDSGDVSMTIALLPGAVVVQALLERAVGTLRPWPRVEPLAVVVAVPLLAGLTVFEFVMRWLVSKDGFYPYWDLHPITLFLVDGAPALVCLWLVAQAGIRRAMPFLAPGGAMLAAVGVVVYAQRAGHEHELAALAVAMFCAGAIMRPPIARFAGVWCGLVAAMVVMLRGQLPRPEVIAEIGYPLWIILWCAALITALVLSDAMRAAPLVAAAPHPARPARDPILRPHI